LTDADHSGDNVHTSVALLRPLIGIAPESVIGISGIRSSAASGRSCGANPQNSQLPMPTRHSPSAVPARWPVPSTSSWGC